MGNIDLQHELSAPGDVLDLPDDIGHRELAVCVGRRADIDGERYLPGMTLVAPGIALMYPTVPTNPPSSVRQNSSIATMHSAAPGQGIAPQRHRHRPGMAGHAAQTCREPRRPRNRGHDSNGQVFRPPIPAPARCEVRHRRAIRLSPLPPPRCDRDRGRTPKAPRATSLRRGPLTQARARRRFLRPRDCPAVVEAKRTPSSSAKPVTSMANGNRRPLLCRSATQEMAVISPSGPSHLPASRTVS